MANDYLITNAAGEVQIYKQSDQIIIGDTSTKCLCDCPCGITETTSQWQPCNVAGSRCPDCTPKYFRIETSGITLCPDCITLPLSGIYCKWLCTPAFDPVEVSNEFQAGCDWSTIDRTQCGGTGVMRRFLDDICTNDNFPSQLQTGIFYGISRISTTQYQLVISVNFFGILCLLFKGTATVTNCCSNWTVDNQISTVCGDPETVHVTSGADATGYMVVGYGGSATMTVCQDAGGGPLSLTRHTSLAPVAPCAGCQRKTA